MPKNIVFAGFGGQGILFAGKVTAYAGLCDGKEVSWLPSYGPEMRGGTANCSVVISDRAIGSPLVLNPDLLIVMNLPSYDKFIDAVAPGGVVVMDSTLIDRECDRADITVIKVPATAIAEKEGLNGLANIILLGRALAAVRIVSDESVEAGIRKSVSAKHADLVDANIRAIKLGKGLE